MLHKRIVNVWRAMIGSGLTNLEASQAEAMLDLEREALARKVSEYNRGLSGYAAVCERLKTQLKALAAEQAQLEPRLRLRLQAQDRLLAGRYALRLEAIAQERQQHEAQLSEAEATYKELVRGRELAVIAAREKLEGLKRSIGDYKVHKALAELTELAAGMQGSLGLSDATLERIKERVDDKRDLAAGRVRVARETLDTASTQWRDAEQKAHAEDALLRFEQRNAHAAAPNAASSAMP